MSALDMRLEAWLLADRYGMADLARDIPGMPENELLEVLVTLRRLGEGQP